MNSQLSEHISANVPIREGPASMIGSACRSGRTSPAFKKPRGHLLSQSVCVKIQVRRRRMSIRTTSNHLASLAARSAPNLWRSRCLNGSIRPVFIFLLLLHALERCEQGFIFLEAFAAAGQVVLHGFERVRNRPSGQLTLRKLRHHVKALAAVDLMLPRDARRAQQRSDLIVA